MNDKILIIYYSLSSHTRQVAESIQNFVGGELASIRTKERYPDDNDALTEQGHREVNAGILPELNDFPVDISVYDTVFLGSPVWWYSVAPAMKSFLRRHRFDGKIVCPFVTNEGWPGHALQDLAAEVQYGFVKTGLNVRFAGDLLVTKDAQIRNWARDSIKDII